MAAVNDPQRWRPFDALGPPSESIDFPEPRIPNGIRANVRCYNTETGQIEPFHNVLFRDLLTSPIANDEDPNDTRFTEGYWRIPDKPTMGTIMGHVEICLVLEPWNREQNGAVVFRTTNQWVAIKVNYGERIDYYRARHAEDPLKEISAMQFIGDRHLNVIGCRQVLDQGNNLHVVMRYCDSGDLFEMIDNQTRFSEKQAKYWFRQLLAGVKYLHSVGICHGDLSPENIAIDQQQWALIIDMGQCLRIPYTTTQHPEVNGLMDLFEASELARNQGAEPLRCLFTPQGRRGKLPYMSPEIFQNREAFDGEAIDVWTCGTILYCMLIGAPPYGQPDETDLSYPLVIRQLPDLLQFLDIQLSNECLDLLQNILREDPQLRLTLAEIENHRWLALPDERPDRANA